MNADNRYTDAWGRVIIKADSVFDLARSGHEVWALLCEPSPEVDAYNAAVATHNKLDFTIKPIPEMDTAPDKEHARRANTWLLPAELQNVDVRAFVLGLCRHDNERDRVNLEMDLFQEKDLLPILRLMIYLVGSFRDRKVVWGVGRGSSVASYVLYLIGIHKIDSLKYNLPIDEFLK